MRLKEYACSIKFNNSMPRKTPSTATAVPLPLEGGGNPSEQKARDAVDGRSFLFGTDGTVDFA